ncbi:MAG: hypothetical protein R3D27_15290 [Hyphomicrobiaceae bacterium]
MRVEPMGELIELVAITGPTELSSSLMTLRLDGLRSVGSVAHQRFELC